MPLTVTIPDEILTVFPEIGEAPDRRVLESLVLNLYREGAISGGKVAGLLGLSRVEAERFLGEHHLPVSPSSEDVRDDAEAVEHWRLDAKQSAAFVARLMADKEPHPRLRKAFADHEVWKRVENLRV